MSHVDMTDLRCHLQMQPARGGHVGSPLCSKCESVIGEIQAAVSEANSTYGVKLQAFFDAQICPKLSPGA